MTCHRCRSPHCTSTKDVFVVVPPSGVHGRCVCVGKISPIVCLEAAVFDPEPYLTPETQTICLRDGASTHEVPVKGACWRERQGVEVLGSLRGFGFESWARCQGVGFTGLQRRLTHLGDTGPRNSKTLSPQPLDAKL